MNVRAPTRDRLTPVRLDEFASPCPPPGGLPVARSAANTAARKANSPINRGRLRKVGRGLGFVFIVRISDQWMNLALFKNARQRGSTSLLRARWIGFS